MKISNASPEIKTWLENYVDEFNELSKSEQADMLDDLRARAKSKTDPGDKIYILKVIEALILSELDFENMTPDKIIGKLNVVFMPLECRAYYGRMVFQDWLVVSSKKSKRVTGKMIRWGLKRAKAPVILDERGSIDF